MTIGLAHETLIDGFDRSYEAVPQLVDGLTVDELLWRPAPDANPIGWLVWHLTRQQDAQVAPLRKREQVWTAEGFAERFQLPYPTGASGYGQTGAEVGEFVIRDPKLLVEYNAAVHAMTLEVVRDLTEEDLRAVIDRNWTPPVTALVRLVSVVDDAAQHCGQAAYVRGMLP